MNALVSIVVPIHGNRWISGLASTTLQSIAAQTYPEIEILIVDDGAEGDLREIETFRDARLVGDGEHRGLAAARNLGLDACRGEYILAFDSDDLMHPDMIERLVEAAQADDDSCDGAYSFYYRLHPDGTRREIRKPTSGHSVERMLISETIPHQTLIHRRVYERSDAPIRYDERNVSAVDLDVKLKWIAAGARLACVEDFLFTHRLHEYGQETGTRRQADYVEAIRARWR